MILEKFYTNKYDSNILFTAPDLTFGEFKKYVYFQINELKKQTQKNVILFGDNYFEFAVNFFASIFSEKTIYLITDKTRLNGLDFDYIIPQPPSKQDGTLKPSNINPKDIKINFFTSGSTGEPKAIVKTFYNIEEEAKYILKTFEMKNDLIVASTTSCAHSFGLTFNFALPFFANYKINRKRIDFPDQLSIKKDYILISTPSFMEKLEKYEYKFNNAPEKIFLAGARLKGKTLNYFKKISDVIDIYGSTETGNIAYKRGENEFTPFCGVETTSTASGQIIVMSEFFPNDNITLSDIIEYTTGKNFIIKARADRVIKVFEKRISLDEIENTIKKNKKVSDCYCMLCDDKFCCAVATDDINLEAGELKNFLLKYSEVVPKKWRFLDEIPRTKSGKVDKGKLKQIFGMNLSLPFVRRRQVSENEAEITLLFKKKCNFFKGHFDVMPILPGVVQLYYAQFFANDIFNIELPPNEVKKVKFSNVIKPDKEVVLKLKNGDSSVEYSYLGDDIVYSTGIFIK